MDPFGAKLEKMIKTELPQSMEMELAKLQNSNFDFESELNKKPKSKPKSKSQKNLPEPNPRPNPNPNQRSESEIRIRERTDSSSQTETAVDDPNELKIEIETGNGFGFGTGSDYSSQILKIFRKHRLAGRGLDLKIKSKPDQVYLWIHRILLESILPDDVIGEMTHFIEVDLDQISLISLVRFIYTGDIDLSLENCKYYLNIINALGPIDFIKVIIIMTSRD